MTLTSTKYPQVTLIDDFLPEYQFRPIRKLLLGNDFPWFFQHTIVYNSEELGKDSPQFVHTFFSPVDGWSDGPKDILYPVLDKINPFNLVRIKANLTLRHPENILSGYHTDFDRSQGLTTAILYINDTDGPTYFSDGSKVECVSNRLIMFPTETMHSGSFCTQEQKRVVINFNFFL